MMAGSRSQRRAFLRQAYASSGAARRAGDFDGAWRHLERAHIVAQPLAVAHLAVHLRMLGLAFAVRDIREIGGQVLRLVLAPLGNVAGTLPIGNTGRARISAFAPMPAPPDLIHFV